MSNLGPLAPDNNPFADDQDETDTHTTPRASNGTTNRAKGTIVEDATARDLAGLQQQHWDDQDQHLDALSASLNRQHEMSLQMNEELDLHQELLEEFDGDTNRTGLRLGGASNQMDRLRNSLKDHGESPTSATLEFSGKHHADNESLAFFQMYEGTMWILGALIIALILLIAFFK